MCTAAVAWLTRAAELSPGSADRARRLGDAAFVAGFTGRLDQAQRRADTDDLPDGAGRLAAVVDFAHGALYQDGDVRSWHRQVAAAIERRTGPAAVPVPRATGAPRGSPPGRASSPAPGTAAATAFVAAARPGSVRSP
ncbi:hypothetical protein LN042_32875 [Kitasatospora sp. RB6PN24]|uniref:hypothetical protein n=1 Tax=Kitasatospora humi TaxID=2893891 RepID=UPI001E3B8687|nr:hypothetical protein [Kitasatospora humi]MCC9311804.1 hypothetical protein [Kitasatospora humi]